MREIILTILLMFLYSFTLSAQSNVTKKEYEVYATILRHIYRKDWKKYKTKPTFLILDETLRPDYERGYKIDTVKNLWKNFRLKNLTSAKLKESFPISYKYQIISKTKVEDLLAIGSKELERVQTEYRLHNTIITDGSSIVWKPFYEIYPNNSGYYQFSRIGFSTDKRFALVLVESNDSYSGDSTHYILREIKGKWKIHFSFGSYWVE